MVYYSMLVHKQSVVQQFRNLSGRSSMNLFSVQHWNRWFQQFWEKYPCTFEYQILIQMEEQRNVNQNIWIRMIVPAPGMQPVSCFTSKGSAKLVELAPRVLLNFLESNLRDALITIRKNWTSFLFFFARTKIATHINLRVLYLGIQKVKKYKKLLI